MTAHWVNAEMELQCATMRATAIEVVCDGMPCSVVFCMKLNVLGMVFNHDTCICTDKWEVPRENAENIIKFVEETLKEFDVTQYSVTTDAPYQSPLCIIDIDRGGCFYSDGECTCAV